MLGFKSPETKQERYLNWIALITLVVALCLINLAIFNKERHLSSGQSVLLKLAPVDPRSLMQGDYMALRFQLGNEIYQHAPRTPEWNPRRDHLLPADGQVIVTLDRHRVAQFHDLYRGQELKEHQLLLKYRIRNDRVKFATNAFFFEEGQAERFETSEYGEFRVNGEGELLLVAMFDKNFEKIIASE